MKMVEARLNARMDNLETEMKVIEEHLNNRIDNLETELHNVEKRLDGKIRGVKLFLENIIVPRLQNIEVCYTTTYERYKAYAEKYEGLELDIEVIKSVVQKHEHILCPTPA